MNTDQLVDEILVKEIVFIAFNVNVKLIFIHSMLRTNQNLLFPSDHIIVSTRFSLIVYSGNRNQYFSNQNQLKHWSFLAIFIKIPSSIYQKSNRLVFCFFFISVVDVAFFVDTSSFIITNHIKYSTRWNPPQFQFC